MSDFGPYPWYVYERLDLPVTDDIETINSVYGKIARRVKRDSERGTGAEKERADLFLRLYSRLRDEEQRKEFIQACFEHSVPSIEGLIGSYEGRVMDEALFNVLAAIPGKTYPMDLELVEPRLKVYLKEHDPPIEIGGDLPTFEKGAGARHISNPQFTPDLDGAMLSWTLPKSDCERIVIARGAGVAPASAEGGEDVGMADRWLDKGAKKGKTYFYSIFSVLDGRPSTTGIEICGYRSPRPVTVEKPRMSKRGVHLEWKTPPGCRSVRIFRAELDEGAFHVRDDQLIVPKGWLELETVSGEEHNDSEVSASTQYYYRLIGDYGDGQYSVAAETSFVTPRGGPEARLVKQLRFAPRRNGALLSWELPPKDCELVVIVRSAGRPPTTVEDGDELHRGKTETFLDDKVPDSWGTYYGLFSVLDGRTSTECEYVKGHQPLVGVVTKRPAMRKMKDGQISVRLSWTPPKGGKRVWIYRSKNPDEIFYVEGERPKVPKDCLHLETTEKGLFDDTTATAGTLLHYHLVADYGDGRFSSPETVSFELPPPLEFGDVDAIQEYGRVTVTWDAVRDGCQYTLYRMKVGETPDIRRSKSVYSGDVNTYPDQKITPGESYEYFLHARLGEMTAGPVSAGVVTIVEEVTLGDITVEDLGLKIAWTSPANATRILVERAELATETQRIDWRKAKPCSGATKQGITDTGLSDALWYVYRIVCIFRDPVGKENRTSGVTTPPSRPFRRPPVPAGLRADCDGKRVRVEWGAAAAGEPMVIRSEKPVLKTPALLPKKNADKASVPKTKNAAEEDLLPNVPWYLVGSSVDAERVFIHRQLFVGPVELEMKPAFGAIRVEWPWPTGIKQMQVEHSLETEGATGRTSNQGTVVETRRTDETHGHFAIDLPEAGGRYRLSIHVRPIAVNKGQQILDSATGVIARVIDPNPAQLSWSVEREMIPRRFRKPIPGSPNFHVDISKRLANFQGIRLLGWPNYEDEDAAEVLLEWPSSPGPVPGGKRKMEFVHPEEGSLWRCRVVLADAEDQTQVLIIPPADGEDLIE